MNCILQTRPIFYLWQFIYIFYKHQNLTKQELLKMLDPEIISKSIDILEEQETKRKNKLSVPIPPLPANITQGKKEILY